MGKRILPRRRGRGSPRFVAPSHRFKGTVTYPHMDYSSIIGGQVIKILNDPARTAPVSRILLEDFREIQLIAPDGLMEKQWIQIGGKAAASVGNVLQLGGVPEGTEVYNIELRPGDGGKLVRTAGNSAYVVAHDRALGLTQVRLPSKRLVNIDSRSLATVGRIAAGGRLEKPLVHAGQAWYAHKAKGRNYPKVSGTSMNACNHPHGGGRHPHVGRPTTVSRNTPPGRKVGHIAARRTGLRKKK